jgi:hypothetical protein
MKKGVGTFGTFGTSGTSKLSFQDSIPNSAVAVSAEARNKPSIAKPMGYCL